jgi:beta-galactosidase
MVVDFNEGWLFQNEGEKTWENVLIPHDAMLHAKRDNDEPSGSGCAHFAGGVYLYKKTFAAEANWQNCHVYFEFQGIYRNSEVFINGKLAGSCHYGYTDFLIEANSFLNYGEENEITVRADNSKTPNSRWYSGGGMYRPVFLHVENKIHFDFRGVRVQTLDFKAGKILVTCAHQGGKAFFQVLDKSQKEIVRGQLDKAELTVPNPLLWSEKHPYLYTLKAQLLDGGKTVDEAEVRFGIRSLSYSPKGFFVNGKKTLLKGGCIHSDNGILGACSFKEAEYRKAKILKAGGFNFIRSAHNPIASSFLDACDEIGLYVLDELTDMWYLSKTQYDYASDFMANYPQDIHAMVRKDFNHPSVIMYSCGNEVTEPAEDKGIQVEKDLVAGFHKEDASRPVTGGFNLGLLMMYAAKAHPEIMTQATQGLPGQDQKQSDQLAKIMSIVSSNKPINSETFNMISSLMGQGSHDSANTPLADKIISPGMDGLDIAGYNYGSGRYPLEKKLHPNRVILGTETMPGDIYDNWALIKKYPYVIGDCMWTAIDYLGEASIGSWAYEKDGFCFNKPYPWLTAGDGDFDLIGHEGAQGGQTKAVWGLAKSPLIYVRPVNHSGEETAKGDWRKTDGIDSWAWDGCLGRVAEVEVYTSQPLVQLYLNGKLIAEAETVKDKASFQVPYELGELKAVSCSKDKKALGSSLLKSAGNDLSIAIHAEKRGFKVGEVAFFQVNLEDPEGTVESNRDGLISLELKGARLLAFGSAQVRNPDQFYTGQAHTYYGRALLCLKIDQKNFSVKASGDNYRSAKKLYKAQ